MVASRFRVTRLALLLSLAVVMASPAGALGTPRSFGSLGSGSGQFIEPQGIAIDQESGDVYIVDSNNYRVDKFTSGGTFLYAWGWGVADGKARALQRCTTQCHMGLRGPGTGQLGFTEGVAVDNDPTSQSYKDVYVVDIGDLRVEKFNPAGEFLVMFGGGVNATAHARGDRADEDVCPVEQGDVCRAGSKGTAAGQFSFRSEGDFVSVGPGGTVYVGDTNRVQEFRPSGLFERQLTFSPPEEGEGPEVGGVSGITVDAAGDVYVVRNGVVGVNEYSPSGDVLRTLDPERPESTEGPTPTLALDASGDVFVDVHEQAWHRVVEYDAAGIELASFDAGMEDGLHGIAFGDQIKQLYVVNTNNNVAPLVARVRLVAPPEPEPIAVCACRIGTGF